jgi:hypothetical protein
MRHSADTGVTPWGPLPNGIPGWLRWALRVMHSRVRQ